MNKKIIDLIRRIYKRTLKKTIYRRILRSFPRILRVNLMMFALEYSPENVFLASGNRHKLPRKNEKIRKTNNVLDDLVIIDDGGFHADEVNLIMRGKSFDFERSNIQENGYLLNGTIPKDYSQHGENAKNYRDERVLRTFNFPSMYVGSNFRDARIYIENDVPIIFINRYIYIDGELIDYDDPYFMREVKKYCSNRKDSFYIQVYHKSKCSTIRPGSGIAAALTLAKLAKKLNIFGWDFYMESSPKFLNHKQALNSLHVEEWDKATGRHFEMALMQWLYASRLKELDHVDIHGYLNDVSYHPKLISKIGRVYYKS
jgi:hypothetical protein